MTPMRAALRGAALIGVVFFAMGSPARAQTPDADGSRELRVGSRVKLTGRFRDDGVFESWDLVRRKARTTDTLWGFIRAVDPGKPSLDVLGFTVVPYESKPLVVESAKKRKITIGSLRVGEWVRVEGKPRNGKRFRARRIKVVSGGRQQGIEKLEGSIEWIGPSDESPRKLKLLGIDVEWLQRPPDDPVVYPDGPRVVRRHGELGYRAGTSSLPRAPRLRLGPLKFGARGRWDTRLEVNFDLDRTRHGDTGRSREILDLEATAEVSDHVLAFADFRTQRNDVIYDQDRNLDDIERTGMRELFVFAKEPWDLPFDVEIGRQDFEDDRQWLYKKQLDALRAFGKFGPLLLEASVGEVLFDAPASDRDVTDYIGNASWHFGPKTEVAAFIVDRRDQESELENFNLGIRTRAEPTRGLRHWLDAAMSRGRLDGERNFGYAVDTGVTYVFRSDYEPSITVSYAVGTGDDTPFDGVNRSYQQTGLQQNIGRWNGVTTFRYYGEIVDPQLTNLEIFTGGVGVHPIKKTSVDLVYHLFRQESTVAERFRDHSRIRRNTNGLSPDIGYEIDLVLGTRAISNFKIELDVGWFHPGGAFDLRRDEAVVVFLQTEVRF
ncbi:MAG: alginate export family protein [Planctomycetes bacterium]|nr:alginate export family protein [Planctomycetota bacterium]MBI3847059.1 alginate export family protein [Planctomycetota bacterium]